MKYLIRIDELNEMDIFLEEKLKTITEKIENIMKLKAELDWDGPSKDAFFVKYDEYIANLKKISNRIILILAFLKSYHSNYDEEYQRLKSKYSQKLLEEVRRWH